MAGLFPVILLVLVLFGILPAAMSWSESYSNPSSSMKLAQLVPGGRLTLSLIIGGEDVSYFQKYLRTLGTPNLP
jgi:tyrosine-specific transport protein